MRLPPPAVALIFLWQSPLLVNLGTPARPEHLRFQRRVDVLSGGSGMACATLDASVLAHTASAAHSDLRLFRRLPGEPETEAPYTLTESGPEPVADTVATVQHVGTHGSEVTFDLQMPVRTYSEVQLRVGLKNFVATAVVEGRGLAGGSQSLGSVPIYDLSAQHLGRSTALLLAETTWPVLHVTLEIRTPQGQPWPSLGSGVVEGAEVPPSRLRQTRYVPTVSTQQIQQRGSLSVALLRVPAHVPVERVAFDFGAAPQANFAREVTVSARSDGTAITDTEALDAGEITHLQVPSGDPGLAPISVREDALDATLGATLARPATVLVAVVNGNQPPLPIRSVVLEMRERKLCFFADREGTYTLRYGDPALAAPSYDESVLTVPSQVLAAQLGPEQNNPGFHARPAEHDLLKRHPELFWLLLLLCGGVMGGTALHHVQHRRV